MKNTEQINININKEWIKKLRKLAHIKSLDTGKEITYIDLIRDAIREVHSDIIK